MNRQQRRSALATARHANAGEWTPFVEKVGATNHPMNTHGLVRGYMNATYSVQVMRDAIKPVGRVTPVGIRRHDSEPIRNWSILQRIKDEVIGEHRVAVQVFPAKDDMTDVANLYWLWILPDGCRWGLHWDRPEANERPQEEPEQEVNR